MKIAELEHALRASAEICEETEFCVIGSQAILGSHPFVDDEIVTRSAECDLYPIQAPEKSERLNVIGELSQFHATHGFYVDGVDETTAKLPTGWKDRLLPVTTTTFRGAKVRGWCLEPHDLLIAKFIAGRPKDLDYCRAVIRLGFVERAVLIERLKLTRIPSRSKRNQVLQFIEANYLTSES